MLSKQELFRTIITHLERIDMSIFEIGSLGMSGELSIDPQLEEIVQEFTIGLNDRVGILYKKVMNRAVATGVLPKEFEVLDKGTA